MEDSKLDGSKPVGDSQATRTFVTKAYATVDDTQQPDYCAFQVNEAFFTRVAALVQLCAAHELTQVRVGDAPELWGPAGIEEEARLRTYELVVWRGGEFIYCSEPKNSGGCFESRSMKLDELAERMKADSGDVVFFDEEVQASYETDHEDAEQEGDQRAQPMRCM